MIRESRLNTGSRMIRGNSIFREYWMIRESLFVRGSMMIKDLRGLLGDALGDGWEMLGDLSAESRGGLGRHEEE